MRYALIAVAIFFGSMIGGALANYPYRGGDQQLYNIYTFVCQTVPSVVQCPSSVIIDSSGNEKATAANPLSTKSGSYLSAGTGQFALPVGTNTILTVPSGATCAFITVEGASIRRTSDGASATSSNGTLIQQGSQWQDCGPLSAYKFTAVTGSPTINAEYFK